jgi:hypothetical protein
MTSRLAYTGGAMFVVTAEVSAADLSAYLQGCIVQFA